MSTVSRTDFDVYLGFWTDWGQGRVNGATLTLTRRDGGFLMSFVAIFIALSGKSLWRICCFIIHRSLSTTIPQDGLHHQRQAILRNADTPEGGAWKLGEALIAWRKHARRPILRLMPLALLAFFIFTALLIGGILSSRVQTDGGSEVLLTGSRCGPATSDNVTTSADSDKYFDWQVPYTAARATAYSNYAMQCYTDAKNSDDCHLYVKPSITTNITEHASCPFAEEMCKSKDQNIIVDSGFINSHYDLGINAPTEERFDLRFLYNCAPISSEGFKKTVKRSNESGSPEVVQYFYGNLTYGNTAVNPDEFTGFTYEVYKNLTALSLPGFSTGGTSRVEFSIGTTTTNGGIYDFTPIPQLAKDDADIVLIYLDAQGVAFADKVDDLWFSAHEKWLISLTTDDLPAGVAYQYLADEPASTLGCTQQMQFCNPNLSRDKGCEPLQQLRPFSGAKNHSEALWSKSQLDALKWTEAALWQEFTHPEIVVGSIGTSVLTARYNLANGICGRLPNNQWQIEIEHFLATTLASLQGAFVEVANGPRDKRAEEYQYHPDTDQAHKICRNQKIRSTLYSSLRVVPLAIIFILGALLIIIDIALEPLLNALHSRQAKNLPQHRITRASHSRLEWRTMSFLQLQRMAHEGIGSGTWLKTTSEIPITTPYQELGMLDIRDQKRPLLRAGTDELKGWYAASCSPTTSTKSPTTPKS